MKNTAIRSVLAGVLLGLANLTMPQVQAATVSFLGIDGELGPGSYGNYPLDADFSWISHRFPDNTDAHIWTLAAGTAGGVAIASAQPGRGEITAVRDMYNQPSWLFSTGDGVQFDEPTQTFDLTGLQLNWAGTIYDFGFGGGVYSALVPLVAAAGDTASANGWWLDADGDYHLVFRGTGQCDGCELTVHLTGQVTLVPLPAAGVLMLSGLLVLAGHARRRQSPCR